MNPNEKADMLVEQACLLHDKVIKSEAFDRHALAMASVEAEIACALYLKDLFWLLGGRELEGGE